MSNVQIFDLHLYMYKRQAVKLGVYFFDFGCIVVQAQSGSVPFEFPSTSLVSQGKKGLTSEHLIGTLRVPAHSILEQGRRYIQTLYASAANTSLVLNI